MKLPSGAELKITLSPFATSRALLQAILEEAKGLKIDPQAEVDANLWKDLACTFIASKKIEACVSECLKRATYNGAKITDDTFEPEECRDDYLVVCFEVTKANVLPFTKSLYAQFSHILEKLKTSLA